MALPLVVAARFGPWLGRVVKSKPSLLAELASKLNTAGAAVTASASSIIKYFKSSPAGAALVLTSIATLGVSTADLMADSRDDPEMDAFADGLDRVYAKAELIARQKGRTLVTDAGQSSETFLPGEIDDQAETYALQDVLSWAVRHYGSIPAAQRAHLMGQAFYELPYNKVVFGFQTLKLRG